MHRVRRGSTATDDFAAILVSSSWRGTPPALWSGYAPQWISLRHYADGRWTIEAVDVEPLVRERSD